MSDSEEEVIYFGTPLEPYDEDSFPKKRPIAMEEQVAKDAQGRRRFHGAFTGGFSAGFFNSVGSLEGWTPSEFKSSRSEKAGNKQQKPEDFMDDEDVGEFGIAHQTVRATKDYATGKKRKKQAFSDGPIPGQPVLESLIEAGNETIGYFLMKNMNYKKSNQETQSGERVYGCAMPKEEALDLPEHHLHDVYTRCLTSPKINTFGLGYVGLDKTHINLFQPTKLTVRERNNKKLSISGQAFGVGAFEEDDEDIYVKDDMSRYDFELSAESSSKKKKEPKETLIFDLFILSKSSLMPQKEFPPPVIPASFTGKHNLKKSRFEPIVEEEKSLDATTRARYLGEDLAQEKRFTPSNTQHKKPESKESEVKTGELRAKSIAGFNDNVFDRFVSAKQEDDVMNILADVKPSETLHGTKEMHGAVKLKMFGPLTHVTFSWQPNAVLCKRFNVPEPNSDHNSEKTKKRTKNLIFEYQKHAEANLLEKPGLNVQKIETAIEETQPDNNEIASTSVAVEKIAVEEATKEPESVMDVIERVDVSKNTDLFKAIFLSSSESESEEEKEESKERNETLTANAVSEPLVLPKIKTTKDGILSNLDFSKILAPKIDGCTVIKIEDVDPNVYGPKLPTNKKSVVNPPLFINEAANNEEWIEKGSIILDGKQHKKQKKKHKKKHKHKAKR